MNERNAFTYTEMLIVISVAAILFLAAIPDSATAAREEGRLLARRFEADVAYARSLTIADPADPVIIKVDAINNRYWLARSSAPDTPIAHPLKKRPYIVQVGSKGRVGSKYVDIIAVDFGGDAVLSFDGTGSTDQDTVALLQLSGGGSDYEVAISPISADSTVKTVFSRILASPY